jgi:pyruvate formate lyase activating enzyme
MIGNITEIKHFATHDGPGIRTTIFLKGCPLKCKWCANPETQKPRTEIFFIARRCSECGECVKACSEQAVSMKKEEKIDRLLCNLCMRCVETCKNRALEQVGTEVTPEEIAKKVEIDRPFYKRSNGGVTISGGEPLYQSDFLSALLKICHERKIHTCVDTCGFADEKWVKQILEHVDLVLFDIKHMNSIKHELWTGVPNNIILKNAKLIATEREMRVSLPLVPGVNDDDENIKQTIEFAKSLRIKYIDIIPLHKLGGSKYEYLGLQSPFLNFARVSEEKIEKIVNLAKSSSLTATIGRSM